MKSIGKFKVIKHKPKANVVYPMIRLPQSYANITGDVAHVFEIENNGKPLFLISLDENFDENVVVQPTTQSDLEKRVASLEQQLKSLSETHATAGIRTRVLSLGSSGHSL